MTRKKTIVLAAMRRAVDHGEAIIENDEVSIDTVRVYAAQFRGMFKGAQFSIRNGDGYVIVRKATERKAIGQQVTLTPAMRHELMQRVCEVVDKFLLERFGAEDIEV